ncbi:MAG: thioredoxin domain-containing protein [Micrococcales bacterium]|nr:thioredoxin domain-containing protein [Micrococcales bacterium]
MTRRSLALVTAVAVGALLLAGCAEVKTPGGTKPTPVPVTEAPTPATADATGGIPVSSLGVGTVGAGDVVVSVYFDVMCPYCGLLDQINGPDLAELVAAGGVTVVYHPVSILDAASQGTAYSTRATNALAVVADQEPEHFVAFVSAILADGTQPAEGTGGLSDDQIATVAQSVGVSKKVTDQFTGLIELDGQVLRTFEPWVVEATSMIPVQNGKVGTPTVMIGDQQFVGNFLEAGHLRASIEAAKP